jgi:Fe2+ or Zn2+ uptake regulation protein
VSCNLAVKLSYGDDSARYDARTDDHCHSRCVRCGQVRDVHGQMPEILPQIEPGGGFRVQGYRVEVIGLCHACAGE